MSNFNIGKRLRTLRMDRGISQDEIAKHLGIGRTTYVKYERGDINPARKLKALADFFGVSIDYLLGNDTPASNPQTTTPARDLLDMLFADEPEFLAKVKNIEMSGKINKPGVLAQLTDRQKERIKDIIKLTYNEALNNGGTATIRTVSSDSKD